MKILDDLEWAVIVTSVIGLLTIIAVMAASIFSSGCGIGEDWQRDAALGIAISTHDHADHVGPPGVSCWDLNGNGEPDEEEDLNSDGMVSGLDCRGLRGEQGSSGTSGIDGTDGVGGVDGEPGMGGVDGATGPSGPAGPEGPQGVQGPPGDSVSPGGGGGSEGSCKKEVCHCPQGEGEDCTALSVGCSAVDAHLAEHQGDYAGACDNE